MIAALFVEKNGVYYGLPNVDPWDESRDARTYKGPWPVVAHPPCARWGRLWYRGGHQKGQDNGCFASALNAVRRYGGVLEHPANSYAWEHFGLMKPPKTGWGYADPYGLTCEVEQGHYGHRARKRTWLYTVSDWPGMHDLPWGQSCPEPSVNSVAQSIKADRRQSRTGIVQRMSKRQRSATPVLFRDMLITLAESCIHDHA